MQTGNWNYPIEYLVLEVIASIKAQIYVAVGLLALVAVPVLFIWLIEYLISSISLLDWLLARWYVPILFLGLSLIGSYRDSQEVASTWKSFRSISAAIDKSVNANKGSYYATGGVRFSGGVIGPLTVAFSRNGLIFWRRRRPIVYLPWRTIKEVKPHSCAKEPIDRATVTLSCCSSVSTRHLVIPWDNQMAKNVPDFVPIIRAE